jgi:hypothetical protein
MGLDAGSHPVARRPAEMWFSTPLADVFIGLQSTEVTDTGRVRLLRFAHYPGKALSCS